MYHAGFENIVRQFKDLNVQNMEESIIQNIKVKYMTLPQFFLICTRLFEGQ